MIHAPIQSVAEKTQNPALVRESLLFNMLLTSVPSRLGDIIESTPYVGDSRGGFPPRFDSENVLMPLTYAHITTERPDPIDLIESLARASDMEAQRVDDTEVHLSLQGSWRDVSLFFAWREEAQVLQIGAPLEIKVPLARRGEVLKLLAMINERLWIGHFDLWAEDGGIVYRNGAVISEEQGLTQKQAETILRGAMDAFEQFYPAFNYVVWAGQCAEDAIAATMLEPQGSA
jgi:hypothetical protein